MTQTISEKQAYLSGFMYESVQHNKNEVVYLKLNNIIHTSVDLDTCEVVEFSVLDKKRRIDFIRGLFDKNGKVNLTSHTVVLSIDCLSNEMIELIDSVQSEPGKWMDINAMEFLATLYYDNITCYNIENYNKFVNWSLNKDIYRDDTRNFKWMKTLKNAVTPTKNRFSDTGFDLTLLSKIKEVNGVCYYDTGIAVQPPTGYYFEIVGRSSISKTGWMLANNIGVIDSSYRGSIIVALVRVVPDAPEIKTPLRLVQLIPRELVIMTGLESDSLNDTTRGDDGFGSSG